MRIFLILIFFISKVFTLDFTLKEKALYDELKVYDNKYKISEKKQWREISDWSFGIFGYSANNQDLRAYATKKGLKNPQEDFIDFAMEFIHPQITTVENSIKCRTPKKYQFMKELFKDFSSPLEQNDIICDKVNKGFLNDLLFTNPFTGKEINFGDINEDTVEGFELLYATPGTSDASEIAGHLLLRIKINNNPLAKKLNILNTNDIVVSFLANTSEGKKLEYKEPTVQKECKKNFFNLIDNNNNFNALESIYQSIKGLGGGFLTIMDRQTLAQTIKHYTIEEDRNLLRFELILTKKQKKDLISHLFKTKKNYNAKYYFFTQNCASVLIKIVAQGIKDEEISNFNPITSPPNTLITLFTKKGLAKPVYPSFYSYRKKAYMAQESIKEHYKILQKEDLTLKWPKINLLFNKNENKRLKFVKSLINNYNKNPKISNKIYKLFNLIQEAEMAYEYKDLICENYTSKVTKELRTFQSKIFISLKKEDKQNNIEKLIYEKYKTFEKQEYKKGEHHTNLLSFSLGAGKNNNKNILHLETNVVKQDMGSLSNIAMQRGNFVKLGSTELNFDENKDLNTWNFSALDIKKFKERLRYIPSYFSHAGEFGLGLNALVYKGNKKENWYKANIAGGEILFNLISSDSHENYLFTSFGAQIGYQKYENKSNMGLMFPAYIQKMITFGEKREIQWQNKFSYNKAHKNKMDSRKEFTSEIKIKVSIFENTLSLLKFKYNYQYKSKNLKANKISTLSLEINNW